MFFKFYNRLKTYISVKLNYTLALTIGLFWSYWILISESLTFIMNPLKYWQAPTTNRMPECVNDSKYGKSEITTVKTSKGRKVEYAEFDIHYMISGEHNEKTIVFIHGFPEFWYSYRYQIPYFNKRYRVIALDLRGYGKSSKPQGVENYQIKHLVNDIKGLFDALDIKSAIMVAHDWGGVVAWTFERIFPERVDKLITLNIPESRAFQIVLKRSFKQFLYSWYVFFFQMPFLPEWKLSRFDFYFLEDIFNGPKIGLKKNKLSKDEMNAFKANFANHKGLTSPINYYRASMRYAPPRDEQNKPVPHRDFNKDTGRYMLIFGDCDGALTVDLAHETKKLVPSLQLHFIEGVSHWVQQDAPEQVNQLIEQFIK